MLKERTGKLFAMVFEGESSMGGACNERPVVAIGSLANCPCFMDLAVFERCFGCTIMLCVDISDRLARAATETLAVVFSLSWVCQCSVFSFNTHVMDLVVFSWLGNYLLSLKQLYSWVILTGCIELEANYCRYGWYTADSGVLVPLPLHGLAVLQSTCFRDVFISSLPGACMSSAGSLELAVTA